MVDGQASRRDGVPSAASGGTRHVRVQLVNAGCQLRQQTTSHLTRQVRLADTS
jgi:hypothetical protein